MSTAVAALGPLEVADVLSAVCASAFPKGDLPTIAINHGLTLLQLQELLRRHGYPDTEAMRRRASTLRNDVQAGAALDPADQAGKPLMAPIGKVLPDPDNLRDELTDIDDLAASIDSIGMLEPIVARRRGDTFVVVAGHRRRAAAARLGRTHVPIVIAELRPADVLVAMLIENGQREDLDPIEEARALGKLRDRTDPPMKHADIGKLIGRSQPYVSGRLALLDLGAEEQQAIRDGHLSITAGTKAGRRIGGHHRPGAQGKASAAHFDVFHKLAAAARALCRSNGHSKNIPGGIIGNVACGYCWEQAIRSDEAALVERRESTS